MKRLIQLVQVLRRARQGGPSASRVQTSAVSHHLDRSSMADFVRILQEQDREQESENA